MFLTKLIDHGTFLAYEQPVLGETAVNNVEVIVLPTTGKQDRVFGKSISCGLIPATAGKRLVHAVIV